VIGSGRGIRNATTKTRAQGLSANIITWRGMKLTISTAPDKVEAVR
jgi:hypothetical protein